MRNRSKSLIAILFISVFLLSVITNSEDSNLQYKVKNEDASLKSSDNGITINTPENIVYNEPMSGFYHGTFGFENELHYTAGLNLEFLDEYYGHGAGVYCDILSLDGPSDGHNKILNMRDAQGGTNTWGVHHIDNPQSFGTIEFFLASNQPTSGSAIKRHYIQFRALDNTIAFQMMIQLHDSTLRYYDGSSWQDIITTTSDVWYHHSINFNCEAGTNGQFSWIVSSEQGSELARIEDIEFENDLDTIEEIYLGTVISDYSGTSRWDAFGFSWDANYEIGDNRNETILLGYETDYDLDWQGYSLDGQENVTIIGNTTLPKLSNGLHSIQVFGNDSIGNNYHSNIRYFTTFFGDNLYQPSLVNGSVFPKSGDQATLFNFTVLYQDLDSDAPTFINVRINGTSYSMEKVDIFDNDYLNGVSYQYKTYLSPELYNYTYYFECSDGLNLNSTNTFHDLEVNETNDYKPQLINPQVSPIIGNLTTHFNFTVWYFDDDNNLPTYVNLTLNSLHYAMSSVDILDNKAVDGIEFFFATTLEPGSYQFQINCSDGLFTNSTDWIVNPEVDPFFGANMIQLIGPSNASSVFSGLVDYTWISLEASFGGVNYTLQISDQIDFSSIVFEEENIEEKSGVSNLTTYIDFSSGLYYWRVRPTYIDYIGDWSGTFSFNLEHNEISPNLMMPSVYPLIGNQYTDFIFTVVYEDSENNAPLYVYVVINETFYPMEKQEPSDSDYTDGCIYQHITTLYIASHNYTYYFECFDGKYYIITNTFSNLKVNPANEYVPYLNYAEVSPDIGNNNTLFNFTVWYFDEISNIPSFVNISINGNTYSMFQNDPSDIDPVDGILFQYVTTLDIGFFQFQINCSDGLFSNSTSWITGPEVNPLYNIDPITLLSPNYSEITSDWINFSWFSLNASFGTVNYTLLISNSSDFSQVVYELFNIYETPVTSNISVFVNFPSGQYYWRVRPTYGNHNGSWSDFFSFTLHINNYSPNLVLDDITPTDGTSSTIFRFTVIYSDLDNNAPEYVEILINGIPYSMEMVDPLDEDFTDGCIYQYLTLLTPSTTAYTISFECSDGVFYDSTSTFTGPLVESEVPPNGEQGLNNLNSTNIFAFTMMLGIPIGIIIPFTAFAEIKVRKMKLGVKTSAKIKKKEIKS